VFAFEVGEGRYRLLFQHLLYEAYLLEDVSGRLSVIRINTGRQYSRMRTIDDSGYIGFAFSWTFGGYQEKTYDKVDDSRFGK
jgi:hypothetical protein